MKIILNPYIVGVKLIPISYAGRTYAKQEVWKQHS